MNRRPFSPMDFEQALARTRRKKIMPAKPKTDLKTFLTFLGAGLIVAAVGTYALFT